MAQQFAPTPNNLRAPIYDALVQLTPQGNQVPGIATITMEQWMTNITQLLALIAGIRVAFTGQDGTAALQAGINQAIAQGGGIVILPSGNFNISSVSVPANSPPVWIMGQGKSTVLTRNANLAAGVGMFDISSSNVTLSDFVIDGAVTASKGLQYGVDFSTGISSSDPMAPSLTENTSVWVHANTSGFSCYRLIIQHTGGYAILLDARSGNIDDTQLINCIFQNNRPHTFGIVPGNLVFGSWTGGIFSKGDGRTALSGAVRNILVANCTFKRNTGNCLWSHMYGFLTFHENIRYIGNYFLDCGLDGILVDVTTCGVVAGNVFRRVGYVCADDASQSVPRWLAGLNATALDSGVVTSVNYVGNSFTSINGGCIDLDGHGLGAISGNIMRIPMAGEVLYTEDQIAITGPTGTGNGSYGINGGNTYSFAQGMLDITIDGNTFINLPAGSIRLYSARFCKVVGNLFDVPAASSYAPIQMGPQGVGAAQRCLNNIISHNNFNYSPGSAKPCVKEDDSVTVFLNTEKNYVFGNQPIIGNGNATEFAASANSGSTTYAQTVWFP